MTLSEWRQRCAYCMRIWLRFIQMPYTVAIGMLLGIVLSYYVQPYAWYDMLFPVVEMKATISNRDENSVTFSLEGNKKRLCTPKKVDAFVRIGQLLSDVNIRRIDLIDTLSTKPLGWNNYGEWKVWPVHTSQKIEIYVLYDCGHRNVLAKLVEVTL